MILCIVSCHVSTKTSWLRRSSKSDFFAVHSRTIAVVTHIARFNGHQRNDSRLHESTSISLSSLHITKPTLSFFRCCMALPLRCIAPTSAHNLSCFAREVAAFSYAIKKISAINDAKSSSTSSIGRLTSEGLEND